MTRFFYYIFFIPLSRLPFSILYKISDFIGFLLIHVIRFRYKIISKNIRNSFPELSKREHKKIINKFYRHFADQWIETLKLFTIGKKEAVRRCKILNPELLDQFKGKHIICVLGHYNNWEMASVAIPPQINHQGVVIYNEIKNPFFDKVIRESRSKFGMKMIPKQRAKRSILDKDDPDSLVFFVADQSGLTSKKVYWLPFLNQDTAVVTGPERYSRMLDIPVVFMDIQKVKRGYYTIEFTTVVEDPKEALEGEITVRHAGILEQIIKKEPSYWLWSHKRWKKGRLPTNQMKYDLEKIQIKLQKEKEMIQSQD